jgi:hypothetical protein
MWQYFAIPAILNAPQLFRGDIGGYAKNTAISGGTNAAIGNIAPNFNMNPTPSYAPGFNPPMASNVGGLLTDSTGTLGNVATSAYTGPTSMMQANLGSNLGAPLNTASKSMMQYDLARPTDVVTPVPENTFQFDAGLANAPSMAKYPDYNLTPEKLGRSLEYTGGGAEIAEVPLTTKVFEKVTDYVKEKPFEAAMLGMMGGGAIYEGLKEPERPAPQPTLGPKLGGGQVNVGSPLQVKRSTPRRRGR